MQARHRKNEPDQGSSGTCRHPLVGDKLYGRTDDEFLAFARNVRAGDYAPLPWLETPRHLLHASRLVINHPISGELLAFDAPFRKI